MTGNEDIGGASGLQAAVSRPESCIWILDLNVTDSPFILTEPTE